MNDRLAHITNITNDWDPVGLFPLAPEDEYRFEIELICRYMAGNDVTAVTLGQYIHRMFTERFGSDVFPQSTAECTEIAEKILRADMQKG